jgi:hypothetical protein
MSLYDNSGQPSGDDLFGDGFMEGMTNPEAGVSYVTKSGEYPARLMGLKTGTTAKGAKFVSLLWMTDEGEYVTHKIYTRSADPLKNRALGSKAAEVVAGYNWTPERFKDIVLSGRVPVLDAIITVKIESNFGGRDYAEVTHVKPVALQPVTVASVISASGDGLPY